MFKWFQNLGWFKDLLKQPTYESERQRGIRGAVDYLATGPTREDIQRQYDFATLFNTGRASDGYDMGWRETLAPVLAGQRSDNL